MKLNSHKKHKGTKATEKGVKRKMLKSGLVEGTLAEDIQHFAFDPFFFNWDLRRGVFQPPI